MRREEQYVERHAEAVSETTAILTRLQTHANTLDFSESDALTIEIADRWDTYADAFGDLAGLARLKWSH